MARRPFVRLLLAAALAAAVGCPGDEEDPGDPSPGPAAAEWDEAWRPGVEEACSRCHAFPPPDSLPRARFAEVLPTMLEVPAPEGAEPLTVEELARAAAFYRAHAPEELPTREPVAVPDAPAVAFEATSASPPAFAKRKIPAAANVRFAPLSRPDRPDLVVSEMRSRAVWLYPPWAPAEQRRFHLLADEANYPVRTEPVDLDQDGRPDLVVAAIGGMDPGNHTKGEVRLYRRGAERFSAHVLLAGEGRVADARPADLDGDGDLDLAVCAFGWRGPGRVLLLENRTEDWSDPRFVPHELDDRDGAIHAEPTDLDGDGRTDLVVLIAQEHEQVVLYRNRGDLEFERVVLHAAPHPAWGYSGLELVDLDGDGDLDVLLSNGDALDDDLLKPYHGASWLENRGELELVARRIGDLYGCERAVAGDVDGDGDLDVVAAAFLPQLGPAVWEESGLPSLVWFERAGGPDPDDWTWTLRPIEVGRCYHPTVDAADVDGDGDLDLAVGNYVWLPPGAPPGTTRSPAEAITLFRQR